MSRVMIVHWWGRRIEVTYPDDIELTRAQVMERISSLAPKANELWYEATPDGFDLVEAVDPADLPEAQHRGWEPVPPEELDRRAHAALIGPGDDEKAQRALWEDLIDLPFIDVHGTYMPVSDELAWLGVPVDFTTLQMLMQEIELGEGPVSLRPEQIGKDRTPEGLIADLRSIPPWVERLFEATQEQLPPTRPARVGAVRGGRLQPTEPEVEFMELNHPWCFGKEGLDPGDDDPYGVRPRFRAALRAVEPKPLMMFRRWLNYEWLPEREAEWDEDSLRSDPEQNLQWQNLGLLLGTILDRLDMLENGILELQGQVAQVQSQHNSKPQRSPRYERQPSLSTSERVTRAIVLVFVLALFGGGAWWWSGVIANWLLR